MRESLTVGVPNEVSDRLLAQQLQPMPKFHGFACEELNTGFPSSAEFVASVPRVRAWAGVQSLNATVAGVMIACSDAMFRNRTCGHVENEVVLKGLECLSTSCPEIIDFAELFSPATYGWDENTFQVIEAIEQFGNHVHAYY